MEPLSGFFMHTRLSALLHVAIHDALNAIPDKARYDTYRPPVETEGPASPRAALAAAGRTMLIKYINYYSNPELPPPFYNPLLEDIRPQVETIYDAQLAAIADGPAKEEGIRIGRKTARRLWNKRLNDGWNNPNGLVFEFPNNDGDNDPMTGLPGEYVMLDPEDTYPNSPQPAFYWWGDMQPWAMTSPDQFLCEPPPSPSDPEFIADMEEVRAYAADDSQVRTAEQTFVAQWWEACPGGALAGLFTFARQLTEDFGLDNYQAARVHALTYMTIADAMISNVNSKNVHQFWRPITAIEYYYPGSDWAPFLVTPSNQEYPAGHPMVTGSGLYELARFFGIGELEDPLVGPSACGTIVYASLGDAVQGVIDARVWGGMHFRGSGEVGARTGKRIGRYVHRNFLRPL
jgi:hypothetical protein